MPSSEWHEEHETESGISASGWSKSSAPVFGAANPLQQGRYVRGYRVRLVLAGGEAGGVRVGCRSLHVRCRQNGRHVFEKARLAVDVVRDHEELGQELLCDFVAPALTERCVALEAPA